MKVIIAEKPDVARHWAKLLNATNTKEGYIEGNGYKITWAYGHLVALAAPDAYGVVGWKKENLPIIPKKFELTVTKDKIKQFKIVKELFSEADEIYVATDADREGELIFRYIYNLAGVKTPFKRLWFDSLTPEALKESLNNIRPGAEFDNLYLSAKSRSESDWLVGINATQAFTINSESPSVLSLGRVQTPVLAIICNRFSEVTNFNPSFYWEVFSSTSKDEIQFTTKLEKKFSTEEEAKETLNRVANPLIVTENIKKEKQEAAPKFFNLSSLQQEANKKNGLTAEQTLQAAQELYEKQYTTYPRADSEFLPESYISQIPKILESVLQNPLYSDFIGLKQGFNKKSFNDKEVSSHHAIVPTYLTPTEPLSKNCSIVYQLIIKRFLAALLSPCIKDVTNIAISSNDLIFSTSGFVIKELGWRKVYISDKSSDDEDDNKEDLPQALPSLQVGEHLKLISKKIEKKTTRSKPLFTDSSLLSIMETGGKEIESEDPQILKMLKEKGLGTQATRANIIEILVSREYIIRDKKKIVPTEKGLFVYEFVKDMKISKAEATGEMEMKLNKIANGQLSSSDFMHEMEAYADSLTKEILSSEIRVQKEKCPKCGSATLGLFPTYAKCSQKDCSWSVNKVILNRRLSDEDLKRVLAGKESSLIKGFNKVDKEGKESIFDAYMCLDENLKLKFKFPNEVASENYQDMACPKCKVKGNLSVNDKAVGCKSKECGFVLWKTMAGKRIPEKSIVSLIEGRVTGLVKGFTKKAGGAFDAKLKLNNEYKVDFVFEKK